MFSFPFVVAVSLRTWEKTASLCAALLLVSMGACSNTELEKRVERLEVRVAAMESARPAVPAAASVRADGGPDPKDACIAAKNAARKAWELVLPLAAKAVQKAKAIFDACWSSSTAREEHAGCFKQRQGLKSVRGFNARVQAAHGATSSGAFSMRDAAKISPPAFVVVDGLSEALEAAKAKSEAAFEACKDVDP